MNDTRATILNGLLPAVDDCTPIPGESYRPSHCLAVYYAGEAEEPMLQLPSVLSGEASATRGGQGCTLLEGYPAKPPGGCLLVGTWDQIAARAPHLLDGLTPPTGEEDYLLRIADYTLLTGRTRRAVLWAAQTFIQVLAACPQREIPGLLIQDGPTVPIRSLLYDARAHEIRPDSLLQILALLSSFRANRLHLLLPLEVLTAESGSTEILSAQEAQQVQQVAAEYGIDIVPWLDTARGLQSGKLQPAAAVEGILAFTDIFAAPGAGIAIEPPAGGDAAAIGEMVRLLQNEQDAPQDLYADASWRDLLGPLPGLHFAAASLPEIASAEDALLLSTDTTGFLPGHLSSFCQQTARMLRQNKADLPREIGYLARNLRRGRTWELEMVPSVVCTSLAWNNLPDEQALERFVALAYGQPGQEVVALLDALAELIPAELPAAVRQSLLDAPFGLPIAKERWPQLRQIPWTHVLERSERVERLLARCRRTLQRNSETLEYADLPLHALRFAATRISGMTLAREHYEAARRGRAGSLNQCRETLRSLTSQTPVLLARLKAAYDETGAFSEELSALQSFVSQLEAARQSLEDVRRSGDLPDAATIGLPPI